MIYILLFLISIPSYFAQIPNEGVVYVVGIAPLYYTKESTFKYARKDAILKMNKTAYFHVKGNMAFFRDNSEFISAGNNLSIEYDTIYQFSDTSIHAIDSTIIDSLCYYLVKTDWKLDIPEIKDNWWKSDDCILGLDSIISKGQDKIISIPDIDGWAIALGMWPRKNAINDANGWIYSEFRAIFNLIYYSSKIRNLIKYYKDNTMTNFSEVSISTFDITIRNIVILAHHCDEEFFYTLVGVPYSNITVNLAETEDGLEK